MKTIIKSKSKKAEISTDGPFVMIGEKINPTGRKKLAAALQEENYDYVRDLAKKQIEAGADAVQIFDSLGDLLAPSAYAEASARWMKQIVAGLGGRVPVIVFGRHPSGIPYPAVDGRPVRLLYLAGPRFANDHTETEASGVDIMLVLDLSWSMMALDMGVPSERVSRYDIASTVLEDFIRKRPDDRIGLLVFSGVSYLAKALRLRFFPELWAVRAKLYGRR